MVVLAQQFRDDTELSIQVMNKITKEPLKEHCDKKGNIFVELDRGVEFCIVVKTSSSENKIQSDTSGSGSFKIGETIKPENDEKFNKDFFIKVKRVSHLFPLYYRLRNKRIWKDKIVFSCQKRSRGRRKGPPPAHVRPISIKSRGIKVLANSTQPLELVHQKKYKIASTTEFKNESACKTHNKSDIFRRLRRLNDT
mmetsp:Transcript_14646/g.20899  ORF Transcript_14646/g.20899 Transcript_14646/m.20899 type:complete len:196 (-) Transcript_14646:170-757(-)